MANTNSFECSQLRDLIGQFRRALPTSAHPRAQLLRFLKSRGIATGIAPKIFIIDIFDAGEGRGFMCRFTLYERPDAINFVAPLCQFSFDRRHPLGRRLAKIYTGPSGIVAA
jgi:hypothetical protein